MATVYACGATPGDLAAWSADRFLHALPYIGLLCLALVVLGVLMATFGLPLAERIAGWWYGDDADEEQEFFVWSATGPTCEDDSGAVANSPQYD